MPWVVVGLVLVALWGAFLLPEVLGSRRRAPLTTTQEFHHWATRVASLQQSLTDSTGTTRNKVLARRRRTLAILIGAAVLSLVIAIWLSAQSMLIAHIAIDGAVAWYLAMLVQLRHRRAALAQVTPVRPASDGVPEMRSEPEIRVLASS